MKGTGACNNRTSIDLNSINSIDENVDLLAEDQDSKLSIIVDNLDFVNDFENKEISENKINIGDMIVIEDACKNRITYRINKRDEPNKKIISVNSNIVQAVSQINIGEIFQIRTDLGYQSFKLIKKNKI